MNVTFFKMPSLSFWPYGWPNQNVFWYEIQLIQYLSIWCLDLRVNWLYFVSCFCLSHKVQYCVPIMTWESWQNVLCYQPINHRYVKMLGYSLSNCISEFKIISHQFFLNLILMNLSLLIRFNLLSYSQLTVNAVTVFHLHPKVTKIQLCDFSN